MRTKISILFATVCFTTIVTAQTVTNVVARQVGNTVEVSYDLDKQADVSLLLSRDGGANYAATPKSLSGDAGNGVTPGRKKIVWNLLQDGSEWNIARARFKVVAEDKSNKVFSVNGVSFTMILVEGGTFTMGCKGTDCYDREKPSHSVTLSDYYIGQTEITQELWRTVMGSNPAYFQKDDKYPVEKVSWKECQQFVQKLNSLLASQLGGKRFALPTEAQWEYAARGGKKSNGYTYSGSNTLSSVAWYTDNSGSSTHPVATKSPNELGLYDMSGNVWEWCQDWYGSYSSASQTNPSGASSGSDRVYRGGSWNNDGRGCRVSFHGSDSPTSRVNYLGLRLVCF